MERKPLTVLQVIIAVVALLYLVSPDLLLGPFDDAAVLMIGTVSEVVLGLLKNRIGNANVDDQEPIMKDIGNDFDDPK